MDPDTLAAHGDGRRIAKGAMQDAGLAHAAKFLGQVEEVAGPKAWPGRRAGAPFQ